ncbi:unnamed protein product [Pleuronectes platessa]|uniref:Uncharacterized protein n=1 Tax=Pleuronectes platessa TaxID=8262 RepID=A0A9N7Y7W3_PLEPL|nr:unnamed protein product [Pleuronectes platessa]
MLSSPDARMPRDHKTPLIKKIAKQACITYRVLKSSADLADSQSELIPLLTAVWAADLKIAPRKSKPCSGAAGLQSPPVTYMHIYETEVYSSTYKIQFNVEVIQVFRIRI